MKTVLSLLFLAILIFCGWSGYKKGLIMGIASLLAFVISIYGADLLSDTYSGEVIDALRPFASGYVEVNVVDKAVRPAMGIDSTNLSVNDFLASNPGREEQFCTLIYENMGIYETTSEQLAKEAVAYSSGHDMELMDAAVEVLCVRIAYVAGFLLSFIMIIIILTVIGNIPNLSFKLPNLDAFNNISGTVLGVMQGIGLCLVIGWALKFTGLLIPQDSLSDTFLVSWFMDRAALVKYLGI